MKKKSRITKQTKRESKKGDTQAIVKVWKLYDFVMHLS